MDSKILIVEDDLDLGNLLKQYMEMNGFQVNRVFNGLEAFDELKHNAYDLMVLDVMMPELDGFSLARKLNHYYPELPFLFVTAKNMREDKLAGLKLGADDYIVKPFDADELILRIRNILKRTKNETKKINKVFNISLFSFDYKNLLLKSDDFEKILTEKEADLLNYLCLNQQALIKREDILVYLWKEPDFFNGRSMDVFMSRLRKYLSKDPKIHIESVRGVGFRFFVDGDSVITNS
ncbi:response regulator transcription factor [Pedobacter sp. N36a]|uniref:response regulator transcription factor n=1 Tax=Pedobacter sp. N36a TaxID=2767996 RepID=UPI001656B2AB|nr:response regulator transcription factor [Pedobacter sp. N36a]MBC8986992.1 response regulator transcription factor [Pedobacter sp. N36a]